ncbi:type II secretion system F family protein [Brevundimonas aurifodinae]|uniref:General secretion pathway protein F n=2 Tax=Brevundimonas TaxID=41275 RepID=A0ABV1NPM9_9CAUL|nr:MAG: type II secretion system protein GspF [Brevundimonas subvibrioides]
MPVYAFQAVDAEGKPHKGTIEAASDVGARQMVRDRGLLPTGVTLAGETRKTDLSKGIVIFRRGISSKTLSAVTRQLSTLIGSDIRIEEALRIAAQQTEGQPVAVVLTDVRSAILEGRSFAAALGRHPKVFPEFYRASIAAGEQSGKLATVLAHLTEFVGNQEKARRKVQLALLYPALLAGVSLLMITLMMVYVVPDIVRVFVSRGAELPFLTRALIGLSAFVQSFGVYVAIALVVAGVAWNRWLAVPANSRRFAEFLLKTPPFAGFVQHLNAARFAGSLATLVRSDVPLVEALQAAAAVTPNRYARERALVTAARVREGASLRRAMAEADVFPPLLLAIVAAGEQSGKLGHGLERAAQDLEQELDSLVQALVSLVEPGVLLVMGGIVLLMVLAILMPIVNLNNLAGL